MGLDKYSFTKRKYTRNKGNNSPPHDRAIKYMSDAVTARCIRVYRKSE